MKITIIMMALVSSVGYAFAQKSVQKPIVDTNAYDQWPSVNGGKISADGAYIMYSIHNKPKGSRTVVLQCAKENWKRELSAVNTYDFSSSGKYACFYGAQRGAQIIDLTSRKVWQTNGIFLPEYECLLERPQKDSDAVVISFMQSKLQETVADVENFEALPDLPFIIFKTRSKVYKEVNKFSFYNVEKRKFELIWEGKELEQVRLDQQSKKLAFIGKKGGSSKSLYVSDLKTGYSVEQLQESDLKGRTIQSIEGFCGKGRNLLIRLGQPKISRPENSINLNIWSYKDWDNQHTQQNQIEQNRSQLVLLLLSNGEIVNLENSSQHELTHILKGNSGADWASLEIQSPGQIPGVNKRNYTAISLSDGKRIEMPNEFYVSPNGKYFVYHDPITFTIFALETSSGKRKKLADSSQVNVKFPGNRGLGGWTANGQGVYIYDAYDIWLLDLNNVNLPINVTGGYGKRNRIKFAFIADPRELNIQTGEDAVKLMALNTTNYQSGFFRINPFKFGEPVKLIMDDVVNNTFGKGSASVLKAENANVFLFKSGSVKESPNYFITSDFRKVKQVSFVNPEKEYNWMFNELVVLDPLTEQKALLYKPENFNVGKKYPVIIYHYEKLTGLKNSFLQPDYSMASIDIPTYVSNGYLVMCPDIKENWGRSGESGMIGLMAAYNYLKKLSFVDSTNIGINGHSYGGFRTNYVVAHSDVFKAAASSAGISNNVSFYGSIFGAGEVQGLIEAGQVRMGKTLWEDRSMYLKNSPVLDADKVKTPILLFHGDRDEAVPVTQGLEFFMALHRLKKKAWLLQYPEEHHTIVDPKNRKDFSKRLQQFFDHYLKGSPPPKWMTLGRPAELKGIEERLELDTSGHTP